MKSANRVVLFALVSGIACLACQYTGLSLAYCVGDDCWGTFSAADYLLLTSIVFAGTTTVAILVVVVFFPDGWSIRGVELNIVLGVLTGLGWLIVYPMVQNVVEAKIRFETSTRLQAIVAALHRYSDSHKEGRLPPATLICKDGRPLLSWRVLILPFLGHEELFQLFRLDEPWDSERNRQLLALMPEVYARPPNAAIWGDPISTFWQVVVGSDSAFDCPGGCRLPSNFSAGLSRTILVVEATEPVPWTKPEDLIYRPDQPFPKLGAAALGRQPSSFFSVNTFCIGWGDGSVSPILLKDADAAEPSLRIAITRNGIRKMGNLYWER